MLTEAPWVYQWNDFRAAHGHHRRAGQGSALQPRSDISKSLLGQNLFELNGGGTYA